MTKQVVVRTCNLGWTTTQEYLQFYFDMGYSICHCNKHTIEKSVEVIEYVLEKQEEIKNDK